MKTMQRNALLGEVPFVFDMLKTTVTLAISSILFLDTYKVLGVVGSLLLFIVSCIGRGMVWYHHTFWSNEEVIYERKGVFEKKQIQIPLHHIMAVHSEQTLLYRLLKLKKVIVQTSAAHDDGKIELRLKVDEADKLMQQLMFHKGTHTVEPNEGGHEVDERVVPYYALEGKLFFRDMLIKGNTTVLCVSMLTVLLWIWQVRDIKWLMDGLFTRIGMLLSMSLLIVVGIGIGFFRNCINYYHFRLEREGELLRIHSGYFHKKAYTLGIEQIYAVKVKQNPVQRRYGRVTVSVSILGDSNEEGRSDLVLFPSISEEALEDAWEHLLQTFAYKDGYHPIAKRYRIAYKKSGLGYDEEVVALRKGWVNQHILLVRMDAVEAVEFGQMFWQKGKDEGRLKIYFKGMGFSGLSSLKGLSRKHVVALQEAILLKA